MVSIPFDHSTPSTLADHLVAATSKRALTGHGPIDAIETFDAFLRPLDGRDRTADLPPENSSNEPPTADSAAPTADEKVASSDSAESNDDRPANAADSEPTDQAGDTDAVEENDKTIQQPATTEANLDVDLVAQLELTNTTPEDDAESAEVDEDCECLPDEVIADTTPAAVELEHDLVADEQTESGEEPVVVDEKPIVANEDASEDKERAVVDTEEHSVEVNEKRNAPPGENTTEPFADDPKSRDANQPVQQPELTTEDGSDKDAANKSVESKSPNDIIEAIAEGAVEEFASAEARPGSEKTGNAEPSSELAASSSPSEGQSAGQAPISKLPQSLFSQNATRGTNDIQLSQPDQARFIQRVARAFGVARNQGGPMRIRLSPPELGSLQLEVRIQNGTMVARVEAETNSARSLLVDNLPVLRERLAEQGIRMERFEVDVPDRQSGGLPDTSENNNRNDTNDSMNTADQPAATDTEEAVDQATTPVAVIGGHEQLNIVV